MLEFWNRVEKKLIDLEKPRTWLSELTSNSRSTITTWVNEDRYPTVDKAQEIAEVLGVSVDFLMTGNFPITGDHEIDVISNALRRFTAEQKAMAKGVILTIEVTGLQSGK